MINRYLFLCVVFLAGSLWANTPVERVVSVYDGDTIRVDIEGWPPIVGRSIPVRLRGVDTPEIRGKCPREKHLAAKAREWLRTQLLVADTVALMNIERGKYFRLVATVLVDDRDVAAELIGLGLGRPYGGGGRESWCGGNL